MQGSTHFVVGVAVGLASSSGQAPLGLAAGAALGGLAALVPDWIQINLPGMSNGIKGAFGHRGVSHWLWAAFLAAYGSSLIWAPAFVPVLVGWGSHVFIDALSNGAPALWQLKRITLARIRTGSWMDRVVGGVGLLACVVLVSQEVC